MLRLKIRTAREALGLSQADVARHLNIDRAAVHNWEAGKNMPSTSILPRLASFLGVSIDDLLATDEQPAPTAVEEASNG